MFLLLHISRTAGSMALSAVVEVQSEDPNEPIGVRHGIALAALEGALSVF